MLPDTTINEEYDIIIAGGGTAGCVIASRLSIADRNLRILILEAGPTTQNDPAHMYPMQGRKHLAPGARTTRTYAGRPSTALGGRSAIIRTGQCLGGGGSINYMQYARASASDYDDWKTVHENPGWSSDELVPLLRKTETYQISSDAPTHGTEGPLKVSRSSIFLDFEDQYLQVVGALDPVRARRVSPDADTNDLKTINIYTKWPKWIDGETGFRSDVPHNMIYPLKGTRPNLHVVTGIHVKHVTFDSKNRATGVAFALNPLFLPDGLTETRTVRGTKLVVVSAGSLGTPSILERSGIGGRKVLEGVGVKPEVDLPGVGENYHDHNIIFTSYFAADEAETLDAIYRSDEDAIAAATAEFAKTGKGLITHTDVEVGIKWRPDASELPEPGPEFKKVWDSHFANAPDKPVLWTGILSRSAGNPTLDLQRKYFTMIYMIDYPVARGHAHITHAEDVSAPIDFVPGFLESLADVKPLMWAYKFSREIARRMAHFRGEPAIAHPAFAPGGPASVIAYAEGPVALDAPRIVYSEGDDLVLEAYVRTRAWYLRHETP